MATEQARLKLTIDEVFGLLPVDQDEVEIERTNDIGNISDPNWSSSIKKFSLGLQNAKETTLSNMIAKKSNFFSLSDFLDFVRSSQTMIFDFMLKIVTKLLAINDTNNG